MTFRSAATMSVLMVCAVCVTGQLYLTIPLVPAIARDYGVSLETAGLSGTAFGLTYAAGFLWLGPLSDRVGRTRVMSVGLLGLAAASLLASMASSFPVFLAARAAQGLAAAAFPPASLALVAEIAPKEQRALRASLLGLAFLLAAPLSQLFSGHWADEGVSAVLQKIAPVYVLGAAAMLLLAGRNAGASPGEPRETRIGQFLELTSDPVVASAWRAAATVLFSLAAFYAGAAAIAADSGFNIQTLRLAGTPALLFTLAATWISSRSGALFTARTGLFIAAAGMALAATRVEALLFIGGAVLCSGVAIAVPGLIGAIGERVRFGVRGLAMAVYSFALFLGASLAEPFARTVAGTAPAAVFAGPALLLMLAGFGLARSGLVKSGEIREPVRRSHSGG